MTINDLSGFFGYLLCADRTSSSKKTVIMQQVGADEHMKRKNPNAFCIHQFGLQLTFIAMENIFFMGASVM